MTYQVANWDRYFENRTSRTVDRCSWVCVPNKQHGLGLRWVLSQPNGFAIYGLWCLIIGKLSHQRLPRDGWLTHDGHRDGAPLTVKDMALLWGASEELISQTLQILSSPQVAWIVSAECQPSVSEVSAECQLTAAQQSASCRHKEGKKEGKEGKKDTPPPRSRIKSTSSLPVGFQKFWTAWPKHHRKQGRGKCSEFWKRHGCEEIADHIVAMVEACKKSPDWLKDGGKFIPGPQVWLNKGSWDTDPSDLLTSPTSDSDIPADNDTHSDAELQELLGGGE